MYSYIIYEWDTDFLTGARDTVILRFLKGSSIVKTEGNAFPTYQAS